MAIAMQAALAAASTPSSTGSEKIPVCRSPSTDLKSFSVMMPWAPALYRPAMAKTCQPGRVAVITAAPVIQGRPS